MLRTVAQKLTPTSLTLVPARLVHKNFLKRQGVYSFKLKKATFKLYGNPHLATLKLKQELSKVGSAVRSVG